MAATKASKVAKAEAVFDKQVYSLGKRVGLYAIGVRTLSIGVQALLQALLQRHAFDTSHVLTDAKGALSFGNRWDAIHFISIALQGYKYEQQVAFMPGWPAILRLTGNIRALLEGRRDATYDDVLVGGVIFNLVASVLTTLALFNLTFRLTRSINFAYTTAIFYILSPHPSAISAPYTEPLYSLLTFSGFNLSAQRRWLLATVCLASATSLRATGIFNIGILGWHILFGPRLPDRLHFNLTYLLPRLALAAPLCAIVVSPLVAFQYYIYKSFCFVPGMAREWCTSRLPFPYAYVQAKYWNNGFLKYWTALQSPNLVIAAPIIIISVTGTYTYYKSLFSKRQPPQPALASSLLPFQILHAFLTFVLVFHSHSQIALRVCISDPVIWWNVAAMAFTWIGLERKEKITQGGIVWVSWILVWGAVSMILWVGHYPPA